MRFESSRAHQRILRLIGRRRPRNNAEVVPPTEVEITDKARTFFQQILEPGGSHQGGALFGCSRGGVIVVEYAVPGGYACWSHARPENPLIPDERYLLGLTDAFNAASQTPIDWVGNWLVFPDSELPGQTEAINWFDQAVAVRLVDTEHCLLMVGWQDGSLAAYAYISGERLSQIVTLRHNLAGSLPITSLAYQDHR